MEEQILRLLSAQHGHYLLESGHHGNLWLDLDSLFVRPAALLPFTRELASRLAARRIEAVVGPLVGGGGHRDATSGRCAVPATLHAHLRGKAVAIVDDAINAGSATRATLAALQAIGARPVAVAALLILGETALPAFAAHGLAVESIARLPNDLWEPAACPMCAAGDPISSPSA